MLIFNDDPIIGTRGVFIKLITTLNIYGTDEKLICNDFRYPF